MNRRVDAVSLLTVYLVLLIALPSRLTVAVLGGAGSPTVIAGICFLGLWAYHHLQRERTLDSGRQPVRFAYLTMFAAFLISYAVAMSRAIEPAEISAAQLGMISVASWGGVLLVANDGISDADRWLTLVRRLVFAGGALATLGIVQFVTGETWVDRISVPGLTATQSLGAVSSRSGFNRPPGTALHGIEFGAVITMILPLAFNLALVDRTRSSIRRWFPVLAILLASFVSISRSALVGCALGMILIAIGWPRRVQIVTALLSPVFLIFLFATIPGLIGTLAGLFTGIGNDSSASSRTDSYSIASEFIHRSPLLGRGYATFMPEYRILDNEYLLLFIEVGAAGLAAVLALVAVGMGCARGVSRSAGDDFAIKQLANGLRAAIAVGATVLALFDGLSFPMTAGTLFLLAGMSGALRRLHLAGSRVQGPRGVPVSSHTFADHTLSPPWK